MSRRTVIPADADATEQAAARAELERAGTAFVEWRNGEAACVLLALEPADDRLTIGRVEACAIALSHDGRVSRRHAELVRVGEAWEIVDGGSTNGTSVGAELVRDRRRLCHGDRIVIGDSEITYHASGALDGAGTVPEQIALTRTQRRVLTELCRPLLEGDTHRPAANRDIADRLMLSIERVKELLIELYARCGIDDVPAVQRRVRLARMAVERGLVDAPQRHAAGS